MEAVNYIKNNELPVVTNFQKLKNEALAYIQKLSGSHWTNLNPSDPGITILDQLCYALTELGYCGSFPLKDILTDVHGELQVTDQFFLPEDILTTAPITQLDYIKLIVDGISGVKNVVITSSNNVYDTYLQLEDFISIANQMDYCLAAYSLLNKNRNLGELFSFPKILTPIKVTLNGTIEIEADYQFNKVLNVINEEINDFIFPKLTPKGYDKLKGEGYNANDIFNGPILKNGWILNDSIQKKKDKIKTFQITKVILSVPGVKLASNISFTFEGQPLQEISSNLEQIIVLNAALLEEDTATSNGTTTSEKGSVFSSVQQKMISEFSKITSTKIQKNTITTLQTAPKIPKGDYRDISTYFSIQNTFPQSYAVGHNAINSHSTDFKIAQSRQLKGYLTVFDQVLSNQFAQLANVKTLFSFKNTTTADPVDEKFFYVSKTAYEKTHKKYPAPFLSFSPTYFYQSLYETVPNLKPLLKNNMAFNFAYATTSPKELNKHSWELLKEDPYNNYIYGLMVFMEEEAINVSRRGKILDHLLARHGVSPETINLIVNSTAYTGSIEKDRIIIKSLYLQNFQELSYNRSKGYNFVAATPLKKKSDSEPVLEDKMKQAFSHGYQEDFITRIRDIDAQEKVTKVDLINFSTIELKLSLLLALKAQYHNYLSSVEASNSLTTRVALWLLQQRKGVLFIDIGVLLKSVCFQVELVLELSKETRFKFETVLTYRQFFWLHQYIQSTSKNYFDDNEELEVEDANKSVYQDLKKLKEIVLTKKDAIDKSTVSLNSVIKAWDVTAIWQNTSYSIADPASLQDEVMVLFPNFIKELNTAEFKTSVENLLDNELPVTTSYTVQYMDQVDLENIISKYVQWYNATTVGTKTVDATSTNTSELLELLFSKKEQL